MTRQTAILVDGDNIGAARADQILAAATGLGQVGYARVYADAVSRSGWQDAPGFRLIHAGTGKNASDVLLCIDAIELSLTRSPDSFVIASSDGDFTHLAMRLREQGRFVLGMGEAKAPTPFRAACSSFVEIGTRCASPSCTELDFKIRAMIAVHSREGRGISLADLAPKMHAQHGTRISNQPERTWRGYLSKRPTLYDLDPKGPGATVRFLPEGFAASA